MKTFMIEDAGYTLAFEVSVSETQKNKKMVNVKIPAKNKNDRNRYWTTSTLQNLILENDKNIGVPLDTTDDIHWASIETPCNVVLTFEAPTVAISKSMESTSGRKSNKITNKKKYSK